MEAFIGIVIILGLTWLFSEKGKFKHNLQRVVIALAIVAATAICITIAVQANIPALLAAPFVAAIYVWKLRRNARAKTAETGRQTPNRVTVL